MITILAVTLAVIFIALLGLIWILLSATKMSKGDSGTKSDNGKGWSKWKDEVMEHGYFAPVALFVVLFAVLWMTDHKLGWFSFMVRDGWTFTAFVFTYIVFVSAFVQDEEKRKKTPFYQKIMVLVMVLAVDFALIGMSPADILKNPFSWNWVKSLQPSAQVAPSQVLKPALWSSEGITKQGVFTEVKVPVPPSGCHAEWSCQDGALVGVVYKKLPQGIIRSCEEDKNEPDFGEVQNLRLTFMSTDSESWYKVEFICN